MSLDCGRKQEYLERTHACTGRTCKLHVEKPPPVSETQDLAARQQCYEPLHSAAQWLAYDTNLLVTAQKESETLYCSVLGRSDCQFSKTNCLDAETQPAMVGHGY
ncbi:hypothetical protein ILYODFUR_035753 [Ilyodon furcidens]|uniref:Uncharacterized protein n=1 Tax=Ilyodon furcidens TaxID=33524 RepID=A0ABV0V0U7_9TELE